jgi:uncharacterized protein YggE
MARRVNTLALFAALSALALASSVGAQDDDAPAAKPDRLAFVVHGNATVPADQVDVEVAVEAAAEDAVTAEKKHREKLKSVVKALEELKKTYDEKDKDRDPPLPGFSIELREGRSIMGVRNGTNPEPSTGSVSVGTCVVVRMKGIEQAPRPELRKRLAKIMDTAIEAGADMGQGGVGARPAFRFRAKDNEALREAAHKDALEKAKTRAARLARLAGRALGPVSSLTERAWRLRAGSQTQDAVGFDVVVGRLGNNVPNNHEMTVSSTEIELEVELALEYELR